jgi:hypothetical protein
MATDLNPTNATLPMPAEQPAQDVVDIHLIWERQLLKLDTIDLSMADERLLDAVCEEVARLEDLLLSTPARTIEGAMAQIRRVAAIMVHGDNEERELEGLRLALTTMARLRRE